MAFENENSSKKRIRSSNFSLHEKNVLVRLIEKYQDILENKKIDRKSLSEKEAIWEIVTEEFNDIISTEPVRDKLCLKTCYENLKKRIKRNSQLLKQEEKPEEEAVFNFIEVASKTDMESSDSISNSDADNSNPLPDIKEIKEKLMRNRNERIELYKKFRERKHIYRGGRNIMRLKMKLLQKELELKDQELRRVKVLRNLETRTLKAKLMYYEYKCKAAMCGQK